VQVLYGEGLASRPGPESCVAVREDRCEALTGECVGQPLSGENQLRGADVLRPSEGNTACVDSARRSPTPRRRRTWHAQKGIDTLTTITCQYRWSPIAALSKINRLPLSPPIRNGFENDYTGLNVSMPDELLAWCEETINALKPKKE